MPPAEEHSLLEWLARRHPESPRKRLKTWFQTGRVRLDGVTVRRPHDTCPDPGDRLQLVARAEATGKQETDVRLHQHARLVFLDGAIAIVNKAAGLLSVPVEGRDDPSALDLLRRHLSGPNGPGGAAFPVHRLDAYTSGLLCFARTAEARATLIEALRAHRLERTYLAFVEGQPASPKGTWEHACMLDDDGYQQRIVPPGTPGSTMARTAFEVLATYRHEAGPGRPDRFVSKLRLTLQTGLKHQIRLQAAAAGTPLIGDRGYHPSQQKGRPRRGKHTGRQALHAVRLALRHPLTGEWLSWEAPVPADLARFEADLKAQRGTRWPGLRDDGGAP